MTDLTDFFGDNSPLKALLPGFQPRAGQAWMAEAVSEALANSDKLIVEAGTGTGKTFAYLLPALLSGRKTITSTGTKALQDQLYHRDLLLIGKARARDKQLAIIANRTRIRTKAVEKLVYVVRRKIRGLKSFTISNDVF